MNRIPPPTTAELSVLELSVRCCDAHHGEGCADAQGWTCCPRCPFGHRTPVERIRVHGWPYQPDQPQEKK